MHVGESGIVVWKKAYWWVQLVPVTAKRSGSYKSWSINAYSDRGFLRRTEKCEITNLTPRGMLVDTSWRNAAVVLDYGKSRFIWQYHFVAVYIKNKFVPYGHISLQTYQWWTVQLLSYFSPLNVAELSCYGFWWFSSCKTVGERLHFCCWVPRFWQYTHSAGTVLAPISHLLKSAPKFFPRDENH